LPKKNVQSAKQIHHFLASPSPGAAGSQPIIIMIIINIIMIIIIM